MQDYFSEKARQIEPESLSAFGITVSSRYGKADELIEMINFARLAATADVSHYVKKVFYDSKATICSFELGPISKNGDPVATKLHSAAKEAIRQFHWFDGEVYGTDL